MTRLPLGPLVGPELRGRRLRAMLLLLVVVTLAAAAIVSGLSTQRQAGSRWDQAFAESRGAHVTISSEDPAALDRVAADPRVSAASAAYGSAWGVEASRGDTVISEVSLLSMAADARPGIGKPLLRGGRWVRPGASDEAVVDRAFALDEGLRIGDRITLRSAGRSITVTVVGQALNLRDTFYPDGDATVWLDPVGFQALDPASAGQSIFLRLRQPDAVEQFVSDVSDQVGTNDWIDTRTDVLRANDIFGTFLQVLGVFVMVAASIVVAGSVATRVLARRRDIGLLKAVGVTPGQVIASIVLAHAVVGALGVLLGWVAGALLSGSLQLTVADVLGSSGPAFDLRALVIALLVVETLVAIATVLPAWRAARVPTTVALAPVPPTRGRRSRLASLGERLGTGPVATAGLRDSFSRPARALLTALALAVAVVAIVVTSGFSRTIDGVFATPAATGEPEQVRVFPAESTPPEAVTRALAATPGVASWFTEAGFNAVLGREQVLANAVGEDVAHAGFVVREGRMLRGRGEAVTGYGFLRRFGLEVGDRFTLTVADHPLRLRIVGWYSETEEAGEMLMFPYADVAATDPAARPGSFRLRLTDGADRATVAAALGDRLGAQARVEAVSLADPAELDPFRFAVDLISGLVIVVALANLASTLVLVVRERSRDIAVLRAVGFTPRQAVAMVAVAGVVLAVVASAVGVPLGWWLSNTVNDGVGATIGMGPGIAVAPSWALVAIVVLLALVVTAGLAVLAARRAATQDVAVLVRYE